MRGLLFIGPGPDLVMAERYLEYFRRSAAASVLSSIADLALRARDAADALITVLEGLRRGDWDLLERALSSVDSIERDGDRLRREILSRLSRIEVSSRDAEKLARLARRIDLITDQVKNTALTAEVVARAGGHRCPEMCDKLVEMARRVRDASGELSSAVRSFADSEAAERGILRVERLEHEVDVLYHEAKGLLPEGASPRFVVLLNDLVNELESAADLCEDAGDVLSELLVRLSLPGGPT